MKRIVSIFFIVLFVSTLSTCHKTKIPKDIPKWLKEKIKKMDKEGGRSGFNKTCKMLGSCREVQEYTDGSSTFYYVDESGSTPRSFSVYNYNGDFQCEYSDIAHGACFDRFNYNVMTFVRLVWIEG